MIVPKLIFTNNYSIFRFPNQHESPVTFFSDVVWISLDPWRKDMAFSFCFFIATCIGVIHIVFIRGAAKEPECGGLSKYT